MNGRIYDPLLGRFLSADVVVQAPRNLQSYNRYSYVKNNPLTLTDPSGFFWKELWEKIKPKKDKKDDEEVLELEKVTVTAKKGEINKDNDNAYVAYNYLMGRNSVPQGEEAMWVDPEWSTQRAYLNSANNVKEAARTLQEASPFSPILDAIELATGQDMLESFAGDDVEVSRTDKLASLGETAVFAGVGSVIGTIAPQLAKLPIPKVADSKLANLVKDLFKGAKVANPIGTGSTADAVRSELATGIPVGGKFHSQKAAEYVKALDNWLKKSPNASSQDKLVAESLKRDLQSAMSGK